MAAISSPTQALITAASTAKTASDAAVSADSFTERCDGNKGATHSEYVAKLQATITAQAAAITALTADIGAL